MYASFNVYACILGSRILQDSLSRVGVTICETKPPALTSAVIVAGEDDIIENMMVTNIPFSRKTFFHVNCCGEE